MSVPDQLSLATARGPEHPLVHDATGPLVRRIAEFTDAVRQRAFVADHNVFQVRVIRPVAAILRTVGAVAACAGSERDALAAQTASAVRTCGMSIRGWTRGRAGSSPQTLPSEVDAGH